MNSLKQKDSIKKKKQKQQKDFPKAPVYIGIQSYRFFVVRQSVVFKHTAYRIRLGFVEVEQCIVKIKK